MRWIAFCEYLDAKLFTVCYMLSRYHVHDVVHRFGQPFWPVRYRACLQWVVILFLDIFNIADLPGLFFRQPD